jgi:hypothetical protein
MGTSTRHELKSAFLHLQVLAEELAIRKALERDLRAWQENCGPREILVKIKLNDPTVPSSWTVEPLVKRIGEREVDEAATFVMPGDLVRWELEVIDGSEAEGFSIEFKEGSPFGFEKTILYHRVSDKHTVYRSQSVPFDQFDHPKYSITVPPYGTLDPDEPPVAGPGNKPPKNS